MQIPRSQVGLQGCRRTGTVSQLLEKPEIVTNVLQNKDCAATFRRAYNCAESCPRIRIVFKEEEEEEERPKYNCTEA